MNITLRQLKYFIEIADQQSITAAAKNLNMSQPPLSAQLKILEHNLGTPLFERQKHKMIITKAGISLRDRAEQILSLVEDTSESIKKMNEINSGTIRIGAITTVCLQLLPEKVKEFVEDYPNVDFAIQETSAERIGELVKNGIIDIGLVREPFSSEELSMQQVKNIDSGFQDDEMVAVGTPFFFKDIRSETIDFAQLFEVPLIIFKTHEKTFNKYSARTKKEYMVVCRHDNPISSIGWAINGLGVAILPRSSLTFTKMLGYDLVVKTIVNPIITANILIVTNETINPSPIVSKFIDLFV